MSELGFAIEHRSDKYQIEGGRNRELQVFMVRAIEWGDDQGIVFKHHVFARQGDIHAIVLPMPEKIAGQIIRFCSRYYVRGMRGFDCKTFVGFTMGWTRIGAQDLAVHTAKEDTDPSDLEPLRPYAIARKDGFSPHLMLGFNTGFNLSVLGPHQPLVITNTISLMKFYRCQKVRRVTRMNQVKLSSED